MSLYLNGEIRCRHFAGLKEELNLSPDARGFFFFFLFLLRRLLSAFLVRLYFAEERLHTYVKEDCACFELEVSDRDVAYVLQQSSAASSSLPCRN